MSRTEANIRVKVEVTNPGQFFACCGLLELADRLWPGAEGWFQDQSFWISCEGTLQGLLKETVNATLEQLDLDDDMASPIYIHDPFDLRLDWWNDEIAGGKQLKVWAGSMRCFRIAQAMKAAIGNIDDDECIFDFHSVVRDPLQSRKKVEPFYFDCRRGINARASDIGFAPDSLKMTSSAFPAVEFLCLVGLQRFRPSQPSLSESHRVFQYHTWTRPLPANIAQLAIVGGIKQSGIVRYKFENGFRTNQKKHKSFLPATKIGE